MGFLAEKIKTLWAILTSVLLLGRMSLYLLALMLDWLTDHCLNVGNIQFVELNEAEGCGVKNLEVLQRVAELLCCDH